MEYLNYKLKSSLKSIPGIRKAVHGLVNPYTSFNDDRECIFIQIPKTASTSIAKAIGDKGNRHKKSIWYKRYDEKKFENYFSFGFVRNPWNRILSAFDYLKRGGGNKLDVKWSSKHLRDIDSFSEFIKRLKIKRFRKRILSWQHFQPQWKFLCDEKHKLIVDYVGSYENIAQDIKKVENKINMDIELGYENVTPNKRINRYYDEESHRLVSNIYERDIKMFDYYSQKGGK